MSATTALFDTTNPAAPGHYSPTKTALLLLDFHSLFINKAGGPDAPAALKVAVQMRAWAKIQGIQVIHATIDLDATPFPTCKDIDRFAAIVKAMRTEGREESAELREDYDDKTEVSFTRRPGYVSALKSPGLDQFLREKEIRSLVLTGLSTSGCVLRTAVAASDAEYVVTVISDACADSVEGVHDMLVGKVLNNRGYVCTAAEFQDGFVGAMSGR